MTTPTKLLERAFSKIGVKAAETPLTAAESSDGLDALNRIIESWNATGILKAVTAVDDLSEDLREPTYATWALQTQLALTLASEYERPISMALQMAAEKAYNNMVAASINLTHIEYPSTVPMGAGNQNDWYGDTDEFFNENQKDNF